MVSWHQKLWGEGEHRMPSNPTTEKAAFASPESSQMASAFRQGPSPETYKPGATHTCPLAWNLPQNPHYAL